MSEKRPGAKPVDTVSSFDGQHQKGQEPHISTRREQFARAIARAELGRHYWDDLMTAELVAARKRKREKLKKLKKSKR